MTQMADIRLWPLCIIPIKKVNNNLALLLQLECYIMLLAENNIKQQHPKTRVWTFDSMLG